jgi:addiction module HigA family antidote
MTHPGAILAEDLQDIGVSLNQLARSLRVPMNRISAIVNGKRGITADTALRLAHYFGTSAQYWIHLQANYDLQRTELALGKTIAREVIPFRAT